MTRWQAPPLKVSITSNSTMVWPPSSKHLSFF
jgi:hypothetical protein